MLSSENQFFNTAIIQCLNCKLVMDSLSMSGPLFASERSIKIDQLKTDPSSSFKIYQEGILACPRCNHLVGKNVGEGVIILSKKAVGYLFFKN